MPLPHDAIIFADFASPPPAAVLMPFSLSLPPFSLHFDIIFH
jgi:hypothetical protein